MAHSLTDCTRERLRVLLGDDNRSILLVLVIVILVVDADEVIDRATLATSATKRFRLVDCDDDTSVVPPRPSLSSATPSLPFEIDEVTCCCFRCSSLS
jgi:hypothetical protein